MTWTRKAAAATAVALIGSVLAACGLNNGSGAESITYLPGVAGDAFYISVGCAAKVEAKKLGVQLDIQAPQRWDPTLQRPILDATIAKNPKAMIVTPTDDSALQDSLNQAKRDGIKIVLSDTTTKDPSVAESSVTGDNVKQGQLAFQAIQQALPKGGQVIVINSAPGVSTGEDREKGFRQAISADPKFRYLGEQFAQDDNTKAASLTSAELQAHPGIVAIFATSGNETQGAATAVRQAGLKGKVFVVGVDAYPSQVNAMQAGEVQALIAQQVTDLGTQSLLQAYNAIKGKPVNKTVYTGSVIITPQTLNTPQGKAALYKSSC